MAWSTRPCPQRSWPACSLAAAQRLAALDPAFGLTKRQLRQRFLARVHDLAVLDAEVDAIWQAPPTLERIRSFMTSLK